MATLRDIKRRIRSIQNTQQIARAMEMVAAAKLRRAQARVLAGRPYAGRLAEMLREVSAGTEETEEAAHPFLAPRPVDKRALVMITSDRGLCGAFNSNLVRWALREVRASRPGELGLVLVGKKGCDAFRRLPGEKLAEFREIGRELTTTFVGEVAERISRLYLEGEVDQVDLLYTHFVSALTRHIVEERLLPVAAEEVAEGGEAPGAGAAGPSAPTGGHVFILEPDPEEIYRTLMPRYLRARVRAALAESLASEQGARMVAMGTAARNAEDLVGTLTLQMNKARQATITRELADIVGSAEAMR